MRDLLDRLTGENIELRLRLDSKLGLTRMDPTQAQQILLNLVLNARDAMPRGGQITIETANCRVQVQAPGGVGQSRDAYLPCALLAVEDNGLGMDESVRSHVFEPFFTTKAGKGTGLGLATVYDIVATSGGLIHVDSQPACGTRISVLLPLVPEVSPSFCDGDRLPSEGNSQAHSSLNED
jgi:signal transduction histidine kinase